MNRRVSYMPQRHVRRESVVHTSWGVIFVLIALVAVTFLAAGVLIGGLFL